MTSRFEVGECSRKKQFPEGLRVMLIDDDPVCLRLLQRQLMQCGFEVNAHQSPTVALEQLRSERKDYFDVVLTDVFMPEIDGLRLLQLIRLEMDDIPVIMLSVNSEFDMVMASLSYGASDYIIKPTRTVDLKIIWKHVAKRFLRKGLSPMEFLDQRRKLDQALKIGLKNEDGITKKKRDVILIDSDDDHSKINKKQRLTWTPELHDKFIDAINLLGVEKAVPKRIHELMNAEGISRDNVASHLQKYKKAVLNMCNFATVCPPERTHRCSIGPLDQIASSSYTFPYNFQSHASAGYVGTSQASNFQGNHLMIPFSHPQFNSKNLPYLGDSWPGSSSTQPSMDQPAQFGGNFLSLDPTSGKLSIQNGEVPLYPSFNLSNDQASLSNQQIDQSKNVWIENLGSFSLNKNPPIAQPPLISSEYNEDSDLDSLIERFSEIPPLSPLLPIEQEQSSPLAHSVAVYEHGESTSLVQTNLQKAADLGDQSNANKQVFKIDRFSEIPPLSPLPSTEQRQSSPLAHSVAVYEHGESTSLVHTNLQTAADLDDQSNANEQVSNDLSNQEFQNQQPENNAPQFDDISLRNNALDTNSIAPFNIGYEGLEELDDWLWMFGP